MSISEIQRIMLTNLDCDNSSTVQELPASLELVPEEISFGGSMTNPMFVSGQIDDGLRSCGEGTVET